jgi:hypothetical protein
MPNIQGDSTLPSQSGSAFSSTNLPIDNTQLNARLAIVQAELNLIQSALQTNAVLVDNLQTTKANTGAVNTALNLKLDKLATGPTAGNNFTKVNVDGNGLITATGQASTADIPDTTDKRYLTEAQIAKFDQIQQPLNIRSYFGPFYANQPSYFGNLFTLTGNATFNNPNSTPTSYLSRMRRLSIVCNASVNQIGGTVISTMGVTRNNGFKFIAKFGTSVTSTGNRKYFGLTGGANTTPTLANPLTDTTYSKIVMGVDDNTGNWKLINNLAGNAPTVLDLANCPINTTNVYKLELYTNFDNTGVDYIITSYPSLLKTTGTLTTNIPALNDLLERQLNSTPYNVSNTGTTIDIAYMNLYD